MNNKGNEAAQQENKNFPGSKLKDIGICDLNDRMKF